jgi:hypothetical protein
MKFEAMLWIGVLILVALAILFPKTRSVSLSAVGVATVALVAIITIANRGEPTPLGAAAPAIVRTPVDFEQLHIEKLDKADPASKDRIRVDEIRFDQIRPEPAAERGGAGSTIVARLYNDSAAYTLTDFGYYLVVQDCIQNVCTTVFDQRGLSSVSVPPRQARDVKIAIRDGGGRDMSPIKILGTPNFLLTATATRAEVAANAKTGD